MKRGNDVLTVDEFRQRYGDRRPSKYGVTADVGRRSIGGHVYASRAEMRYAEQLYVQLMALELVMVVEQPRVALGVPENIYVPDFLVMDQRRGLWFVDVKVLARDVVIDAVDAALEKGEEAFHRVRGDISPCVDERLVLDAIVSAELLAPDSEVAGVLVSHEARRRIDGRTHCRFEVRRSDARQDASTNLSTALDGSEDGR